MRRVPGSRTHKENQRAVQSSRAVIELQKQIEDLDERLNNVRLCEEEMGRQFWKKIVRRLEMEVKNLDDALMTFNEVFHRDGTEFAPRALRDDEVKAMLIAKKTYLHELDILNYAKMRKEFESDREAKAERLKGLVDAR